MAYYKIEWDEKERRKPENILEIKKAMLECGFCSPVEKCLTDNRFYGESNEYIIRTRTIPYLCMIQARFTIDAYHYDGKGYIKADPPKLDTRYGPIPERSVERRLNSEWCTKIFPQSEVCKP